MHTYKKRSSPACAWRCWLRRPPWAFLCNERGRASDRESGGHFAVSFTDSALGDAPGIRLPGVAEMVQKTLVEGVT